MGLTQGRSSPSFSLQTNEPLVGSLVSKAKSPLAVAVWLVGFVSVAGWLLRMLFG
jgi:hypothetical protein